MLLQYPHLTIIIEVWTRCFGSMSVMKWEFLCIEAFAVSHLLNYTGDRSPKYIKPALWIENIIWTSLCLHCLANVILLPMCCLLYLLPQLCNDCMVQWHAVTPLLCKLLLGLSFRPHSNFGWCCVFTLEKFYNQVIKENRQFQTVFIFLPFLFFYYMYLFLSLCLKIPLWEVFKAYLIL